MIDKLGISTQAGSVPQRPVITENASSLCDIHLSAVNKSIGEIEYRLKDRAERLDTLNFEQNRDTELLNVLLKSRNIMQTFFEKEGDPVPTAMTGQFR